MWIRLTCHGDIAVLGLGALEIDVDGIVVVGGPHSKWHTLALSLPQLSSRRSIVSEGMPVGAVGCPGDGHRGIGAASESYTTDASASLHLDGVRQTEHIENCESMVISIIPSI